MSIQSHVVHGYVGNKCCVFPLNRLGIDVDAVNSVQFSNHTGYPTFKGQILDGYNLRDLFQGLRDNQILSSYTHVITGYIGSPSFLKQIEQLIHDLRAINPNLVYGTILLYSLYSTNSQTQSVKHHVQSVTQCKVMRVDYTATQSSPLPSETTSSH